MKKWTFGAACFAAAVMLLSSCGAILEEATEQVVERGLEEGGVDIDIDDVADGEFNVTFEDENGEQATLEIDGEEGSIEFESEDGEGTVGIGPNLAEDWPEEFPLPDDLMVVSSVAFEDAEQSTFQVIFTGPQGSFDRYYEHFLGYDLPVFAESQTSSGGGMQRSINWGTDEEQVGTMTLTDSGEELAGQVTLVLNN